MDEWRYYVGLCEVATIYDDYCLPVGLKIGDAAIFIDGHNHHESQ